MRPRLLALFDRVALAICVVLPTALALSHASFVDDGAHDGAIVRALGFGASTTPSIDALVAAPFVLLPVGTLVFRLALASAMAAGAAAVAIYVASLRLIAAAAPEASGLVPRALGIAVALSGALAATLSPAWQLEAAAPLSSAPLAAIALGLLALALGPLPRSLRGLEPRVARGVGLAVAVAFGFWFARWRLGLAVAGDETPPTPFDGARIVGFFAGDVGVLTTIAAAAGLVLALVRKPSRAMGIAVAIAVTVPALAIGAGGRFSPASIGPEQFGIAALVAAGIATALSAVAFFALALWIARLRVPLASASAAMVALLVCAFPAVAWDEASIVALSRASLDRLDWSDAVLGGLRPHTLVVVEEPRVTRRLLAASLTGEAPEGLAVVPLHDIAGRIVRAEVARTPELVPLLRDVTLTGVPTEVAMSKLAESRSVAVTFASRWDKPLARHLTPAGAFDRFEVEPRGHIERKKGLDVIDPALTSLARGLSNASARELAKTTALVLRSRVTALVAANEKEAAQLATAHVRGFSPDDAPPPIERRMISLRR